MTMSGYQINSVIKTYMKNIKSGIGRRDNTGEEPLEEDNVIISEEGMKRVLLERIGERMTD